MRLGGHQLVRRLRDGEGRQVFSAIDLADHRPAVLKIAAIACPADVERLDREFAVLRAAAGPGVVPAWGHSVALPQGMAWLVLAAQGPSLAAVLASLPEQRLAAETALAAVHAAATALGELHARGWRHGDIKPGNLLCQADGSVVLSDLELAARADERPAGEPGDRPRAGTPPFIAPELWRAGPLGPSPASDAWALGVTLFVCLFGDYPFGRDDDRAIAQAIDRGLPPRLAELPQPLSQLLSLLLARDPSQRPADGKDAARRIAATAEELGIDLAAARRAFGLLVAAVPGEEVPSEESPPEPGTMLAPAAPEPPSVIATPPRSAMPPPSAVPSPSAPPLPEGIGAADPFPPRPMGVGAGGPPQSTVWRRPEFFDVISKLDVSSRAAIPPPLLEPATRPPLGRPATEPSTATGLAPAPPIANAVQSAAPAPAVAPPLTRRAAARWYRRMNPARNFPLSVVFSGKQIRIVGGSGLGVTLGRQEIVLDPADPVLSVEPWFPGCLISPQRAEMQVADETTVCRFWITPLVCGELPEACVTIRHRGKVVETLATPAKVVTRTAAKVLATLGLVSPLASIVLDAAGWNLAALLQRAVPYATGVVADLGPLPSGACVAGILLTAALGYFYVTRPLLSEEPEPAVLPQPV
jgi:serine/threonine-protein kinase